MSSKEEIIAAGIKAFPAVVGTTYAGYTLSEWAAIATIIYVVIQVTLLLQDRYWKIKDRKKNDRCS